MNSSDTIQYPVALESHTLQLLSITPVPMIMSRADGSLEYVNPALIQFLGFQPEEISTFDFIVNHQHQFILNKDQLQLLESDLANPLVADKEYTHRSGDIFTAQLTIIPQIDKNGEVVRFISQIMENLESEKTREKLQLASLVTAKSNEGMMVTDKNGIILDVNSAFSKITGYTKKEVTGKNASMLSSGQQDKLFYKLMWRSIVNSGHWKGEVWNKRKNGEHYPVILSINTDFSADGQVKRRVALLSDQTEIKAKEKQIFRQAYYDSITGLPNRIMFIERLNHIINLTRSKKRSIALMLLDLDGFKEVNDTLGHEVGDEVLKITALRLLNCVDSEDVVARLGGDEFSIINNNIDHLDERAQTILKVLSEPFEVQGKKIYISASIGITLYPQHSKHVSGLLKNADQAMYDAKKRGRNRFSYFSQSMQQLAEQRVKIIEDLRKAIENQQFILHFQPIIDLSSNEIYKAEALLRWWHPQKGLVYPDQFISIAEESGLIVEIGKWLVNEALQQTYVWRETYRKDFQLSVNESPLQFKVTEDVNLGWIENLRKLNLSGGTICIEITENLLMDSSQSVDEKIQNFKDAGIQVALDDFGTGYASLSYLKRFDIDFLKIDKSYIQSMESNKDVLILCESIIDMAHKLGIKVVAEGIETQQQLTILKSMGCDFGQGYLFSKPLKVEDFDLFLSTRKPDPAGSDIH